MTGIGFDGTMNLLNNGCEGVFDVNEFIIQHRNQQIFILILNQFQKNKLPTIIWKHHLIIEIK